MGKIEKHGNDKRLKRIRFSLNGNDTRLTLGKVTVRQAEEVNRNLGELLSAKATGYSISEPTAHWLNRIADSLYKKLVQFELVPLRKKATLATFLKDYIASRTDLKPSSVISLNQTAGNLIEFFGRKRKVDTMPISSVYFYTTKGWQKIPFAVDAVEHGNSFTVPSSRS